ncbi:hypothetical protein MNBD_BACTEROID03-1534 [hydrothermal vent metagenome]|uniref:PepSY domain-containing protein n=1 Tax=hydrothermal vent metagenome TaxID=652676 RepID=A0A3B0TU87_9ZZZZ
MKKVMLVAVMCLGTMTAFAQEEAAAEAVATEVEATQEEATAEAVATQDGFTEVALEELPAGISAALATDHPGATISKAYVNEAAQYKLEVANEDGTTGTLFADAEGNWIEM